MPAAFTILYLTGGGATVDLVDGVNFALIDGGWAPQVAARRVGTLAGTGVYEDVEEEITVNVMGTTAAIALENLRALSGILDVADRWSQGDISQFATLTCQPQGSVLSGALSALLTGRGGDGFLGLPVTFNDRLMIYEISEVRIRFKRRGLWLSSSTTTGTITGSPANMATTMSASFAGFTTGFASPVDIRFVKSSGSFKTQLPTSYILVGLGYTITITEAETLTATAYTSVADAANFARGGSHLRYTPTVTTLTQTATYAPTVGADAQQLTFFASVRNNSASATWTMRVRALRAGASVVTPDTHIDASTTLPRIVPLGSLSLPESNVTTVTLRLEVTASTTSGPPTLDIDYIAMLRTDAGVGRVIAIDAEPTTISSKTQVRVSHLATSSPGPRVSYLATTSISQGHRGDAFIATANSGVYVAWLATNGDAKWNLMDSAGTAIENVALTSSQTPAYLVPQ